MVFGLSKPTAIFCFHGALVQLVAAVIWTLQIYALSLFLLRLDIYTVGWTPRLDGALDISSQRCIRRLGYDLDVIQGT